MWAVQMRPIGGLEENLLKWFSCSRRLSSSSVKRSTTTPSRGVSLSHSNSGGIALSSSYSTVKERPRPLACLLLRARRDLQKGSSRIRRTPRISGHWRSVPGSHGVYSSLSPLQKATGAKRQRALRRTPTSSNSSASLGGSNSERNTLFG